MPDSPAIARRSALLLALLAASCAQRPTRREPADTEPPVGQGDVGALATGSDADVESTVTGLWTFADRFAEVTGQRGQNAVFSPASLGYAFGMLRAGAGGQTARQLDEVFGFPASVHNAFAVLRRDVVTTDKPPSGKSSRPIVALANGLFLQQGWRVQADYERTLRETYGAAPQYVDFTSAEATKVIDAWVREQTADRIDKLFDEIDPRTIAVLANAVYLKAFWANQFDAALTEDGAFHLTDGGTVDAPMMRLPKPVELNYARGAGWQAVELPYRGDELVMWVLVPAEGREPPRLTGRALRALAGAEQRTVDLLLPRWDFGQTIELLPELEKLGLTALSNLPGFSPEAFVGDAIHRANITVDESGTEAAAVTGIAVQLSAGPTPLTLRADRPFTFAVVHKPTGAPLFLGTVADPTKS